MAVSASGGGRKSLDASAGARAPIDADADAMPAGPALTAWLEKEGVAGAAPYVLRRLAGGRTNLTYRVDSSDGRAVVVRRSAGPPSAGTVRLADRERRVIAALSGAGLPVPATLGHCADEEVFGSPFVVMEWSPGLALDSTAAALQLEPAARARVATEFGAVLARIHDVDLDRAGLQEWRRSGRYMLRQLDRWLDQATKAVDATAGVIGCAGLRAEFAILAKLIADALPATSATSLLHGDYRLDNVLVDRVGRIVAVIDWELAAVGDPLSDLAYALVMWEPFDSFGRSAPTSVDGFADPAAVLRFYLATRAPHEGAQRSMLDPYLAFGAWRAACIGAVVLERYSCGAEAGTPIDVATAAEYLAHYLTRSREFLEGDSVMTWERGV